MFVLLKEGNDFIQKDANPDRRWQFEIPSIFRLNNINAPNFQLI